MVYYLNNTRAHPLFCLLDLLHGCILFDAVVVVCLSSLCKPLTTSRVCITFEISPRPRVFRWGYVNTEKVLYCFCKIILRNTRESKRSQPCLHSPILTHIPTNESACRLSYFIKSCPYWKQVNIELLAIHISETEKKTRAYDDRTSRDFVWRRIQILINDDSPTPSC